MNLLKKEAATYRQPELSIATTLDEHSSEIESLRKDVYRLKEDVGLTLSNAEYAMRKQAMRYLTHALGLSVGILIAIVGLIISTCSLMGEAEELQHDIEVQKQQIEVHEQRIKRLGR